MKKIAVLMSAYNGQNFIEEQINSILSQQVPAQYEVRLYIRDDHSSDLTRDKLETIAKLNTDKIVLLKNIDGNLGVTQSFFEMLDYVESDYYFFSDQDDVWLPRKIVTAINVLQNVDVPALYYGTMTSTDQNLNIIRTVNTKNSYHSYFDSLNQNLASGLTMAFNKQLVEVFKFQYKNINLENVVMHDAWIFLLATTFGLVFFDETPYVLYRQHGENVVGSTSNSMSDKIRKTLQVFEKEYSNPKFKLQVNELLRCYGSEIETNKLNDIQLVLSHRGIIRNFKMFRKTHLKNKMLNYLVKFNILFGRY